MNRFKLTRFENRQTVAEVAERTGLSERTIYKLEAGHPWFPGAKTADAIADYYDLPLEEVMRGVNVDVEQAA